MADLTEAVEAAARVTWEHDGPAGRRRPRPDRPVGTPCDRPVGDEHTHRRAPVLT